jgi:hypothetical protein
MRIGVALLLVVLVLVIVPIGARASTVEPVGNPNTGGTGCQPGGLFGHVAPEGNALVGVLYPDPATQEECVLGDGATLSGDTLQIWLFTPNPVNGSSVPIGVEEFRWGSVQTLLPGPNGTTFTESIPTQVDVLWSNASVPATPGTFQEFGLQVPPVFVSPQDAENLTVEILGLELHYRIATPGTALPVAETLGGLIGWLALMSPAAVISFIGGFGPGQWFVGRLRYVSSGKWACFFVGMFSLVEVATIAFNFTSFLYWLGDVGVEGLGLLLLVPCLLWGTAFWITVRGRRLPARLIRAPIAKSHGGEPVAGVTAIRIFGGGKTGHAEELVEGFGVGGPGAAWDRLLGLHIRWRADKICSDPRVVHYDWSKGSMDLEGEYPVWSTDAGKRLDYTIVEPAKVWFPWRKAVRARFENGTSDPKDAGKDPQKDADHDPTLWAHRGFFLGLRHGEASAAVLGSPDYLGPDQYIRGVSDASDFAREAAKTRRINLQLHDRIEKVAERRADEMVTVRERMLHFPSSPEAMEGLREISTRDMGDSFDEEAYLERLRQAGQNRVDYRPPGASKYSSSVVDVRAEALEPIPPPMDGRPRRLGGGSA